MNKQELIDYCNAIKENKSQIINCIDVNGIIKKIEQLDEPEKVKVPQFVADWIEYCKIKKISLAHALYRSDEAENKSVYRWIVECLENQETFARAWLDGYEVEKEKRYTVVMKGTKQPLFYNNLHERLFFSLGELATRFTRKQIEDAGLGEVFNSPLFEVEEVE